MGDFRIVVEAAGGHGCDRNAKEGDQVVGCGRENCPDCITARFVSELQRAGMRPYTALFKHWPSDLSREGHTYTADREVIDDYTETGVKYPAGAFIRATGKRVKGHF